MNKFLLSKIGLIYPASGAKTMSELRADAYSPGDIKQLIERWFACSEDCITINSTNYYEYQLKDTISLIHN